MLTIMLTIMLTFVLAFMLTFMEGLLILAMFLVRVGVPLLVMIALGYALSRLDARWQAEADAARQAPAR